MISVAAVTHPGLVRSRNEDTVVLPGLLTVGTLPEPLHLEYGGAGAHLFAVVDGMGGQRGGQEASRHVGQYFLDHPGTDVPAMLSDANRSVYARMAEEPSLSRMGATVAGALVAGETATVFNVGDSRVYHFAERYLMLVTTDDRRVPGSSVVTQSLGGTDRLTAIAPHLCEVRLEAGQRLLVCSDGLSEVVQFEEIQEILDEESVLATVAHLLESALREGGPDNVSIVVLEVGHR